MPPPHVPPLVFPLGALAGVALIVVSAIAAGAWMEHRAARSAPLPRRQEEAEDSGPPKPGGGAESQGVPGADGGASDPMDGPRRRIVADYARLLRSAATRSPVDLRPLTPREVTQAVALAIGSRFASLLVETQVLFEEARYSPHPIRDLDAERFGRAVATLLREPALRTGR
ncbi:MAG TPA: hypothetical protein VFG07_08015 [Thermoplasmata archaeon]|nr:hypothetical protein [Thermoplasmata archaeon]